MAFEDLESGSGLFRGASSTLNSAISFLGGNVRLILFESSTQQ